MKNIAKEMEKHEVAREKNPDLPIYDVKSSEKNEQIADEKEQAEQAIKKAI
jgi:hypothetical protein